MVCALLLASIWDSSVEADFSIEIRLKEDDERPRTVSCFAIMGVTPNGAGRTETFLQPLDPSDDETLVKEDPKEGEKVVLDFRTSLEPLRFAISELVDGIEKTSVLGNFDIKVSRTFTVRNFDASDGTTLVTSIDTEVVGPDPANGTLFAFVDGRNASLPGIFVGTEIDLETGIVSSGYTGTAEISSPFQATITVPEPSSLRLSVGASIAILIALVLRRRSRRRTSTT